MATKAVDDKVNEGERKLRELQEERNALAAKIRELGEKLFAAMDASPTPGIFSKKGAYARVMDWSMKDPAFKTQLFRFVDVLPALKSSGEIVRHLQEYLGDKAVELNPAMKVGLAASSFAPALIAGPVKANVVSMAEQFIAGETPDDLVKQLRKNAARGMVILPSRVVSTAPCGAIALTLPSTAAPSALRTSAPGFNAPSTAAASASASFSTAKIFAFGAFSAGPFPVIRKALFDTTSPLPLTATATLSPSTLTIRPISSPF